ncbi:hypothetical protein Trydic_g11692 [Trypoxylus dichotomus]
MRLAVEMAAGKIQPPEAADEYVWKVRTAIEKAKPKQIRQNISKQNNAASSSISRYRRISRSCRWRKEALRIELLDKGGFKFLVIFKLLYTKPLLQTQEKVIVARYVAATVGEVLENLPIEIINFLLGTISGVRTRIVNEEGVDWMRMAGMWLNFKAPELALNLLASSLRPQVLHTKLKTSDLRGTTKMEV